MRFTVKRPTTGKEIGVHFPAKEKDVQEFCDALRIDNDMKHGVIITEVYNEPKMEAILKDKQYNFEELNYFMKRFESFDQAERSTFYTTATALKYTEIKDLINLTYNLHCYGVVADFTDLNQLGKNLYLQEVGASSADELRKFDGKGYVEQMMADNPTPLVSPYGFVYPNKNEPEEVYNGKTFPAYWHDENPITIRLETETDKEFLYLPCEDSDIMKALERLEVADLSQIDMDLEDDRIPKNIADFLYKKADSLDTVNNIARKLGRTASEQKNEYLSQLVEFTKVSDPQNLSILLDCSQEFKLYPNVYNAEQYGRTLLSDGYSYDPKLVNYIDFEQYGKHQAEQETGVFTDKGYLVYHGYNGAMEQILEQTIGIKPKDPSQAETLKLYMPLQVTTYYEEDDYGRYRQTDYEGTLDSRELCGYEDELNEFLNSHQPELNAEREMMEYYDKADTVNAKVKSYHFEFEQVGGDMYGVVVAQLNAPLTQEELQTFKEIAIGQSADGLGEGIEQREFEHGGRDIHIHLWSSENWWFIKTAEEMGFTEHKHSQGMEMNMA